MPELYQREIEEILNQIPQPISEETPRKSQRPLLLQWFVVRIRSLLAVVHLSSAIRVPISVSLVLLAVLVSIALSGLFGPIVWLGLFGVILVYFLFFVGKSNPDVEKRWRGRVVEQPRVVSEWSRFWYRLRRILRH